MIFLTIVAVTYVFCNFGNIVIFFKKDIAVIEEDFSSIYFDGREYVPFEKYGGYPPQNDKTIYYDAVVKNDDLLGCLFFRSTIARNADYNDVIWLFTELDYEYAPYFVFITQDALPHN